MSLQSLTLRLFITALLSTVLAGCVTTMDTPVREIDEEKAENSHVDAGFAYLRNGDKDSARRHFQSALKINTDSAGAYNGLALVYQFDNDLQEADLYFKKALSLDPSNSQARNNYASFLFKQERYTEAEKQLLKVVTDQEYGRRYMALLNLGRTELKLGKEERSIGSLRQAIGLNPRLFLAHLELAGIYFDRKDYPSSKYYLDQYSAYKAGRPSAESLWLKIRLERIFGNKDKEASAALALKNMHPYSEQYLRYKKTLSE